jgi:hypothetical protein
MNYLSLFILFSLSALFTGNGKSISGQDGTKDKPAGSIYQVKKLKGSLNIDGNWDKAQWKRAKSISMTKAMGKLPAFIPQTEAKMMYDDANVYVIFRVKDRYVRSVVQEYNGNVSSDSCVEFFFSPDANTPLKYFNLEVNAGGTPLIFYVTEPWTGFVKLQPDEIKEIEIAHSLPSRVDPEIKEPVTWTIEYRIPLSLLRKYSNVSQPGPGVKWKANFYKTASKNSNPHYLTWSFVDHPKPNFHLPQFFGTLIFSGE